MDEMMTTVDGRPQHTLYAKRIPVGWQGADDDEEEEEEESTVPAAPLAQAKPPVNIITSSSGMKPCRLPVPPMHGSE